MRKREADDDDADADAAGAALAAAAATGASGFAASCLAAGAAFWCLLDSPCHVE